MNKIGIATLACIAVAILILPGTVSAWGWTTHRGVTSYAAYYGQHDTSDAKNYWNVVRDYSTTPDTWGESPYYHGYNTFWSYGGAPDRCEHYAYIARSCALPEQKAQYLGYSLHYMEDVGNPYHTVFWTNLYAEKHDAYESWVDNNFWSGENYYVPAYYGAIYSNSYASVSDPSDGVVSLAGISNGYISYVDTEAEWQDNGWATYNCVWYTSSYSAELIDWI